MTGHTRCSLSLAASAAPITRGWPIPAEPETVEGSSGRVFGERLSADADADMDADMDAEVDADLEEPTSSCCTKDSEIRSQ